MVFKHTAITSEITEKSGGRAVCNIMIKQFPVPRYFRNFGITLWNYVKGKRRNIK